MKLLRILGFLSLFTSALIYGHDGHDEQSTTFISWLGGFHPLLLHFPIALAVMTGIAECLSRLKSNQKYDEAAHFMLNAAAIMVVPTVICGLALGYNNDYSGELQNTFWWHRFFGITTAALLIATAYIRHRDSQSAGYLILLTTSILSIAITGYLGGILTFGPLQILPPG